MAELPAPYAARDRAPIPTEPGFYWLIFNNGDAPQVAELEPGPVAPWVRFIADEAYYDAPALTSVARYVGPLTPPSPDDVSA